MNIYYNAEAFNQSLSHERYNQNQNEENLAY
jgi:hypothetical protein